MNRQHELTGFSKLSNHTNQVGYRHDKEREHSDHGRKSPKVETKQCHSLKRSRVAESHRMKRVSTLVKQEHTRKHALEKGDKILGPTLVDNVRLILFVISADKPIAS